jgi:CheY-like chemotaxis protein/anti-sigma regulatory factor (Ser/Thr protein kinase)
MPPPACKHFACSPLSASAARTFVVDAAEELGLDPDLETLRLLVSELATNAIKHARTSFDVCVEGTTGGLRVEVCDRSLVAPAPTAPSDRGGFGLGIVDTMAERWGIVPTSDGKAIWFELPDRVPTTPAQDRPSTAPTYSIGAVSRLLAVEAATLRAWEQRYGAVVPLRTSGGHRLYSRDQIDHLRFVLTEMAAGRSASDAHRVLAQRIEEVTFVPTSPQLSMLVLVAERDRYAAELSEYFLRTEGFEVRIAFDGSEARSLQQQHRPDLVILELLLAGGTAIDLCREFADAGIPVLAVSSLAAQDAAISAGASAFLVKPLEPLQLISTVRDLLGTSAIISAAEKGTARDAAHH